MNSIETIEYEGFKIEIVLDEHPSESPREYDNLGTIYTPPMRRHKIADKEESGEWISAYIQRGDVVALPVYMIDHSGIALSTSSFGDPWDSGQIGYIAVTREKANRDYGRRVNRRTIEKHLRSEIEVYSAYVQGEVYGYRVFSPEGEETDSCWGYIGTGGMKCAIEDAKSIIRHYNKEDREVARMERECFAL
jgi:hypothetical protein